MELLKGKNILLGISGSIAAYKALEIVRLFVKAGANVRVIMSEDAKKFVTPLSFETLSSNIVLHEQTQSWANDNNHIHINKWADIFLIAPATANTINKLANGIADNLLTSTALASTKQILIAPAANTAMLLHECTQNSLKKLQTFGYKIIDSEDKLLACNDKGIGALANLDTIFYSTVKELLKKLFWEGKKVIVTGGGTVEKIDDVRYLSNFSSGKMAQSLCKALYIYGANVVYITTLKFDTLPIKTIHVQSASQMEEALKHEILNTKEHSFLFMCAAISDFKIKKQFDGKIKKENFSETFTLDFEKNNDILKNINKQNITAIGFKAEVDKNCALDNAKSMLKNKNLDAVCLNIIDEETPFGGEKNKIVFIQKDKETTLDLEEKSSIAFKIISCCEKL